MKITRRHGLWTGTALLALVSLSLPAVQAQESRQPRPEVIEIVQAIIGAANGNDAAVDTLVTQHFAADQRNAKKVEAMRAWFTPLRTQFGELTVGALRRASPDTFLLEAEGAQNGRVTLMVTHDEAFKITALEVQGAAQ